MTYSHRSLGNLSDSKLSGWYRFSGGAGTQMAETCPKIYSCSTNSSGWLSGRHPTVAEAIVQRKVCFLQLVSRFFRDCCNQTKNVSVRNCGAFYVYRLNPPDYYSRYCGNGLLQAPGKHEVKTSSLVCKYGSKYGIYRVCYRFALEQTYFCIMFALCKFDANPFFRPVKAVTRLIYTLTNQRLLMPDSRVSTTLHHSLHKKN